MNAQRPSVKTLRQYINSAPLFVLYTYRGDISKFNKYFWQKFKENYPGQVGTVGLDLSTVNYANREFATFIRSWIPSIGLPRTNAIYPGHYLFRNGVLIGYHPGTFDANQVDSKGDGISAIVSAIAGTVVGIIEKNARKGVETFLEGMIMIYGLKIFEHFQQILKFKSSGGSQTKGQTFSDDTLSKAYKLLKISPLATDQEVAKAWRKLVNQYHPDRAMDEKEKEKRNRITVEINQAYSLIKSSRSKRKKEQTVS